ncbi:hypothetical protein AB836_01920 [Rickettsiales bacterium (ex Bugula neritina AB1)]|nr:hypothetical protein AB836_01920 [Rickettsiales bacterium (ex Bugula neritina AB1)]
MQICYKKLLLEFIVDIVFSLINLYFWINKKISKEKIKKFLFHHHKKNFTPNMGGVPILISLIPSLLIYNSWYVNLLLIGNFTIGLIDDLLKNKKNLSNNYKMIMWCLFNIFVMYIYKIFNNSIICLPFGYYGDLGYMYILFTSVFILLTINAINITDGLDGLATFPVITNCMFFILISYLQNDYNILYVTLSFLGVLISFLFFNIFPAKIFMSDSGSLLLGSFIAISYIQTKSEFFIFIVGSVFIINILTSFLQVTSLQFFKYKLFKIAPLHHYLEFLKFQESTIVFYGWLLSLFSLLIGVMGYLSYKSFLYESLWIINFLNYITIAFIIFLVVLFILLKIKKNKKK